MLIQDNARILAFLDVICGFYELADKYNYCKPAIENSNLLEIKNIYSHSIKKGHEGVIVKDPCSIYRPGKR